MDEHRVGLQPILRRVWAPQGQRPTAPVHPRYEWLYVYGFVQPATGAAEFLLLPMVSVDAFGVALTYNTTHKLVRYKLGAKLKVARPSHIKKC